jgi:uncharacterized protein YwqG
LREQNSNIWRALNGDDHVVLKLFTRWFGGAQPAKAPKPEQSSETAAAVIGRIRELVRPCLRLVPGEGGRSWLGGSPDMTGAWPRYQGAPLGLVAQLDLAEMRAAGGPDWLPDVGRLLFFYSHEHGGWGFEPTDAGSSVVLHETGAAAPATEPSDLAQEARFDRYPVSFAADLSYCTDERLGVGRLSDKEERLLEKAIDEMTPAEPAHQVGGYPGPIQGDGMERECQLVTNGLPMGSAKDYDAARAAELAAGAADWRLLLQVDSDDAAGMMWGDSGRLYFWIREQDARAGDFSKSWTILQCC